MAAAKEIAAKKKTKVSGLQKGRSSCDHQKLVFRGSLFRLQVKIRLTLPGLFVAFGIPGCVSGCRYNLAIREPFQGICSQNQPSSD
jgi:hypothetical protein